MVLDPRQVVPVSLDVEALPTFVFGFGNEFLYGHTTPQPAVSHVNSGTELNVATANLRTDSSVGTWPLGENRLS